MMRSCIEIKIAQAVFRRFAKWGIDETECVAAQPDLRWQVNACGRRWLDDVGSGQGSIIDRETKTMTSRETEYAWIVNNDRVLIH